MAVAKKLGCEEAGDWMNITRILHLHGFGF